MFSGIQNSRASIKQNHENLPVSWRIDLLAIELDHAGKPIRRELFENAVTET